MEVKSRRERHSHCFISAPVCEAKRKSARKKKLGRPTACKPQRVAFCFQVVEAPAMARQARCSRTVEDCERIRKLAQEWIKDATYIGECEGLLNTDRFDGLNDWTDLTPANPTP